MTTPSVDKILQCMQYTFENIVMPDVRDDYAKSQSLTLVNLFRYTINVVRQQGETLWEQNRTLQALIRNIAEYLNTLPRTDARDRMLDKLKQELPTPPNGYPSIEYLVQVSHILKQQLEDVLSYLVAFPSAMKADGSYQSIREEIRKFLVEDLQTEDRLMTASFTSKRR